MKITWILLFLIIFLGGFLRIYGISQNPPGLYIDEVSIGLNAYDVLRTGKDQYGISHPIFFRAFGEYKMPVYIYMVAGTMKLFGKNELAIRLPSAILGTLSIGILFFLAKELYAYFDKKKNGNIVGLLAAFILAISPWHLQFSRGGFEATVALCLFLTATTLFVYFLKYQKTLLIILSVFCLGCVSYTYDGYRLIVPLAALGGFAIAFKKNKNKKSLIIASGLLVGFLIPIFLFTSHEGFIRFAQTSAFSQHFPTLWGQVGGNITTYIKNYLSFFSLTYLFRFGDQINRHQVFGFGLMDIWQLPYIVLGLYFLLRRARKVSRSVILFLLFIAPLTAALTVPSPHSLRFLLAVIPFTILTAFGLAQFLQRREIWIKCAVVLTCIFICTQFGYYIESYWKVYPKEAQMDWGGSCKEVAAKIDNMQKNFDHIIYSDPFCVPEYFLFYAPSVSMLFTNKLQKPLSWEGRRVLLIKQKNKLTPLGTHIDDMYSSNLNHDVFVQLWSL